MRKIKSENGGTKCQSVCPSLRVAGVFAWRVMAPKFAGWRMNEPELSAWRRTGHDNVMRDFLYYKRVTRNLQHLLIGFRDDERSLT